MKSCLVLFVVLGLLRSVVANAEIPPNLRPGTHPMWVRLGLGGAVGLTEKGQRFMLAQQFGYHFTSRFGGPAAGPAIAVDLQESFDGTHVVFEVGPRFVWDISIVQGLGLYLTPSLGLGYTYFYERECWDLCRTSMFNVSFALAAKLIIADRGMVFIQPFALDLLVARGVGIFGDVLAGGGVIF